ncbi:MAG: hypothetical protein KBT75_12085 [Oleispira antarctica]|uniref:PhoP regulatory network protein YrbL n=1 Tax=Oleispira antarctica RB-8 TaxID=698738 RepID=R4YQ62_OLEAN|nr:hypothetical protein [Oleispira antarctica]MBQ0793152.1 hypothetical protein [Oleispira antarctica]CCK74279.1 conserved hypothetical protein [Oleispira antarctica RB-8]|tara:strand:- start:8354 stop:8935 length:582 start_codon:yes stop_codon:yes gene_type:complete
MNNEIYLTDELIVGKGRDRVCYQHPHDSNLCIKVSISDNKQSKREVSYFNFLNKKNTDLSKISVFRGTVKTDKGLGYTFDLIRDYDKKVSKTLRQCLESQEFSIEWIQPQLNELKNYLISNKICVRDISPSNISCERTPNGVNLLIIDGVSNSNINPLTIRLQSLVNTSIDKAWKGLERKLARIDRALMSNNE